MRALPKDKHELWATIVEYTYKPAVVKRSPRLFGRSSTSAPKKNRSGAASVELVAEVVLSDSLLARLGYWLLMRSARVRSSSQVQPKNTNNAKVTRSQLRQNLPPVDSLAIVAADGRKSILSVRENKPNNRSVKRASAACVKRKSAIGEAGDDVARPDFGQCLAESTPAGSAASSVKQLQHKQDRSPALAKSAPQQKTFGSGEKIFEQDLFEKTERNITAAMKEAHKGISAEQLVIRFGLSIPEAGLIASMYK